MGFRLDIREIAKTTTETVSDLWKLINPHSTVEFFRDFRQKEAASINVIFLWVLVSLIAGALLSDWMPLLAALFAVLLIGMWFGNYMNRLLFLLGLSVFLGYSIYSAYFSPVRYTILTSIKIGYVYWMVSVFVPAIAASVLHSVGERLIGRVIGSEEANAVATYSMTPALMGGIFRLFIETTILHYLVMAYSIYILYVGIENRFGFDRTIHCFIVLMLTSSIAGMLLFQLSVIVLGIPAPYY